MSRTSCSHFFDATEIPGDRPIEILFLAGIALGLCTSAAADVRPMGAGRAVQHAVTFDAGSNTYRLQATADQTIVYGVDLDHLDLAAGSGKKTESGVAHSR